MVLEGDSLLPVHLNALDTVVTLLLISLGIYLVYKLFGVCTYIIFNILKISFFLLFIGVILAFILQMEFATPLRQELFSQYHKSVITPPIVGFLARIADKTADILNIIIMKLTS